MGDATAHQVAEVEDTRIGDAVEDLQSLSTPGHDPGLVELLEVLGNVRLLEVQQLDEVADALLLGLKLLQNPQPHRFAEQPEAAGDHL